MPRKRPARGRRGGLRQSKARIPDSDVSHDKNDNGTVFLTEKENPSSDLDNPSDAVNEKASDVLVSNIDNAETIIEDVKDSKEQQAASKDNEETSESLEPCTQSQDTPAPNNTVSGEPVADKKIDDGITGNENNKDVDLSDEAEEVEEAFIDKESDDDVQYIDEEVIEEKDQELCDILEGQQDKSVSSGKIGKDKQNKGKKIHNDIEMEQNENFTEENNFEEISDGSMDPLEQSETVEAISDNEIIIDITNQEKEKGRTDTADTLEQVFMVTQNETTDKVVAEDKDNDDISDASLCGDDENDNLSLEEISDEEFDSSKRRNLSHSENIQDNKNKKKDNCDIEEKDSVTAEDIAISTQKKHPLPESDNEKDENPLKKVKLGQDHSGIDHNTDAHGSAAFYTNISSFSRKPMEAGKSTLRSCNENLRQQNAISKELSPSKQISVSTQTLPLSRRGKIVQCNISPIDSAFNSILQDKGNSFFSTKLNQKYKDQLPASISDIFQEVTSTSPPKQGSYRFTMGPVTHADIDNPEFRNISLKFVEKFQLSFNSKHQGVFTAQLERQEDVASLIRRLKRLELGTRYIVFSVIYRHGPDNTEDCLWKASIIFMYSQDRQLEKQKMISDGKERARLSVSSVPKAVSKDFIQMLFPESLYISARLGPSMERSLTLGYSSYIIVEETSTCYELLLINGQKINMSPMDPIKEVPSTSESDLGYVDENGIVLIADMEANVTEENMSSKSDNTQTDNISSKINNASHLKSNPVIQEVTVVNESNPDLTAQECLHAIEKEKVNSGDIETKPSVSTESEFANDPDIATFSEFQSESVKTSAVLHDEEKTEEDGCNKSKTKDSTGEKDLPYCKEPSHNVNLPPGGDTVASEETGNNVNECITGDKAHLVKEAHEKEPVNEIIGNDEQNRQVSSIDCTTSGNLTIGNTVCTTDMETSVTEASEKVQNQNELLDKKGEEKVNTETVDDRNSPQTMQDNVADVETEECEKRNEKVDSETVNVKDKDTNVNIEKYGKGNEKVDIETVDDKVSPQATQTNEANVETERCEKDACLEDVSDDEMINAESKQNEDDKNDVIILQEDSSTRVIAEIDLTKELDDPGTNSGTENLNSKGCRSEEKRKFDEKLNLTDGNLQVTMEVIDVEVQEDEPERVLYPKYYGRSYAPGIRDNYQIQRHKDGDPQNKGSWYSTHNLRPGSRCFTRGGEVYVPKAKEWSAGFSYYKNESNKIYEKVSSTRSGNSLGDSHIYDAPGSSWIHKSKTAVREKSTEHHDNYRRDYRRSKSPSPRRELGFERKTSKQHSRHSEHFQHSRQPYSKDFSHGYSYGHVSGSQGRGFSEWHSDHPDSKRRETYPSSSDQGKIVYHSRSPPYESHKAWKDDYHPKRKSPEHLPTPYDMKTQTTATSNIHSRLSDDRRTPKRYRRTHSRSLSPLSDKSLSPASSHSRARKSRTRRSKERFTKGVSRSPISISSKSRSLSPVSKSPTPQRFRSALYKSSKDQYSAFDRNKHSRSYLIKNRSRSRSPIWSKSKAKSRTRSPPYKKDERSPPYKRVALSPVTNRERAHDKHVMTTSSKPTHSNWQNQNDKNRTSASYDASTGNQLKVKTGDMKSSTFGNYQQGPPPGYGFPVPPINYNTPLPFPQWSTQTAFSSAAYTAQQPSVYSNPPVPTQYNYSNMPAYTNTGGYSYSYDMPTLDNNPNQLVHTNYNPYAASVPQGTSQSQTMTASSSAPGKTAKKQQESSSKKWSMGSSGGALVFQRILSSDSRNKK